MFHLSSALHCKMYFNSLLCLSFSTQTVQCTISMTDEVTEIFLITSMKIKHHALYLKSILHWARLYSRDARSLSWLNIGTRSRIILSYVYYFVSLKTRSTITKTAECFANIDQSYVESSVMIDWKKRLMRIP